MTITQDFKLVRPNWPIPANVRAATIISPRKAASITFKGNSEIAVAARASLESWIKPSVPLSWLTQPHQARALELPSAGPLDADGAVTSEPGVVCAMRSADCLPVFIASSRGDRIGIAHAGWKGLRAGIIEGTIALFARSAEEVFVWLGPAISGPNYEVGEEVADQFKDRAQLASGVFTPGNPGKYYMDLYAMARNALATAGIPEHHISGGDFCTFSDLRMHSVRRDGEHDNRMASVIWLTSSGSTGTPK